MNNNKHAAMMDRRQEMMQQKLAAGSIATHFPEVTSIVMNMTYNQKGSKSIFRTFYFTPSSYAFFMINCLRKDCADGGFDLTQVVNSMIRNRKGEQKGELSCKGSDLSTSHSDIIYEVAIEYTSSNAVP